MTEVGGTKLEVVVVPRLGGTPYYGFAVRAHATMLSMGQAEPGNELFTGESAAVVAKVHCGDEAYAIGVLTFSGTADGSLFVGLAYVDPDYRGRGVYRSMVDELHKAAERAGASKIVAATWVGNPAGDKAIVALGFRMVGHYYEADVAAAE